MKISLKSTDNFTYRHIGPREDDAAEMLQTVNAASIDALVDETIPASIRLQHELELPEGMSEYNYLQHLRAKARLNKVFRSYIGLGYYGTVTPPAIQRNIFENPGWYTQYTPYQAEISQGRLEALLNFQTMVSDLTALPIANASLLDEGTAAAEAMLMFYNQRNKGNRDATVNTFLVSDKCFPQTIDVLKTRAEALNIELKISAEADFTFDDSVFGLLLQYPAADGGVEDYRDLISAAKGAGVYVVMAADILSLALITPPGELGADVAVGNTQRFGVPMGFGGPHAAFLATTDDFKRVIPGRIIGVSIDSNNNTAYRMALQTREQHIRREKATSNICTAQALLAIMAGMYGVYHGQKGIRKIATRVHALAAALSAELQQLGYRQVNEHFFDTITFEATAFEDIRKRAEEAGINFRYRDGRFISIAVDEVTQPNDLENIIGIFTAVKGKKPEIKVDEFFTLDQLHLPESFQRTSDYLTHPVFNTYHSETRLMRYIKSLENKDLSLTHSMIPLGSCTMKLNAAAELMPVSWPEFSQLHPFVPLDQAQGYMEIIEELENYLSEITGFAATSLQPNSGAQGEYAGLLVIQAYHQSRGDQHRTVSIIPSSAHGTNPASAVMAGMEVVVVKCDEKGNIDVADLRAKAEKYKDTLSNLMITYPSTHGVFEESVKEICSIIHQYSGQVYMDGANMNAQVGLTNPANIGADVCHLNLHKTFAIPHGGGGPGMGPICVREHLKPFLPGHPVVEIGTDKSIHAVSAAPWGSASILLISYGYIRLLGKRGVTQSTKYAILNANYIKSKLEKDYKILFVGDHGRVAHELIVDLRPFKNSAAIEAEDVAKRLIDYGFHAPTLSFPVPGTIMIEPTESEDKLELDRFCDALIQIRQEIREIEEGNADAKDNVLKNSPHTVGVISSDNWNRSYSREKAAYPLPYVRQTKFWPAVGRVNNPYGDRNLICTCPPVEMYQEPMEEKVM